MPTPPPTGPLVTRGTLADDFAELGVRPGETLLAHTSLSSRGWVCGRRRRRRAGTPHSAHPQTSFAALGPGRGDHRRPRPRLPARLGVPPTPFSQWVPDTGAAGRGGPARRDRPVVRGKAGAAGARLFPVADAVAYAERRLALHRPRALETE
ncbi:hypothetical protein SUDANB105_05714 [Streptomyces sp. enrichment culture]